MFAVIANIAKNIIAQFHGAIVDIPVGWALCNGTLGTPDLQDKFIVGAGSTYNPADTGGTVNHRHSISFNLDDEELDTGTDIASGSGFSKALDDVDVIGQTYLIDNLPPYYALAYIMKL